MSSPTPVNHLSAIVTIAEAGEQLADQVLASLPLDPLERLLTS